MSPALEDGDYIVTIKPRALSTGLIYVINHSDLGRIVKRLDRLNGNRAMVSGDNPSSTPSSVIGPVEIRRITRRAILRISKSGIHRLR